MNDVEFYTLCQTLKKDKTLLDVVISLKIINIEEKK